ncbi:hypothetical protein L873DRAFT_1792745 [Choiromyces venosus 120613-1]|uniref:Uncharacterized protein n=1 Tax=Choiromyces venosus 120613-1 TaxID=1336337 RepID=A0A3N4J8N9_9PEZI|nr:hypothetical protein L873DRAFT_1792745 [Choiromyces venosus 120613-1]
MSTTPQPPTSPEPEAPVPQTESQVPRTPHPTRILRPAALQAAHRRVFSPIGRTPNSTRTSSSNSSFRSRLRSSITSTPAHSPTPTPITSPSTSPYTVSPPPSPSSHTQPPQLHPVVAHPHTQKPNRTAQTSAPPSHACTKRSTKIRRSSRKRCKRALAELPGG